MDWRRLPSLSALRAFEAAARTGSLSRAGAELNVTHAAISQHVRTVEREVGASLLDRGPRGVVPTPAGAALAEGLGEGFGRLLSAVEATRRESGDRPLRIATTPTLAENWLMPRLGGFWAAHPGVATALLPGSRIADLSRGEADLAIRYGGGDWPGLEAERLLPADFVVVASPALACEDPDPARCCWYLEDYRTEQRAWAEARGLIDAGTCLHLEATNALTLAAVRAGHGLSAQTLPNVASEIAEGRLVALRRLEEPGLGYFLVRAPGPAHPHAEAFAGWLRAEAAATAEGLENASPGA